MRLATDGLAVRRSRAAVEPPDRDAELHRLVGDVGRDAACLDIAEPRDGRPRASLADLPSRKHRPHSYFQPRVVQFIRTRPVKAALRSA